MALNKVILMGRLTADPELKTTQSGLCVTNFTLAVDRRGKGEDKQADFISCQAWRQTAEFIAKYFRKGNQMAVVGELQTRSWTDGNGQKRYATDVVVSEASFCESKKESEGNATHHAPAAYIPDVYKTPDFEEIGKEEELPF